MTLDEQTLTRGRYKTPPTPMQVEAFKAHILSTGSPETIPDLDWSPPDLSLKHEIVTPIEMKQSQRPNDDLIPCASASCGGKPKFLDGVMLWSSDGHIRIVGNCCIKKYLGASTHAAISEGYKHKIAEEEAEKYLWKRLPLLPSQLAELKQLESSCEALKRLKKNFCNSASSLVAEFQKCLDNDGFLTVERKRTNMVFDKKTHSSKEKVEFWNDRVAYIGDISLILKSFDPLKQLSKLETQLSEIISEASLIEMPEDEEEMVMNALITLEGNLSTTKQRIDSVEQGVMKLQEQLRGMMRFFSSDTLKALDKWGKDKENKFDLQVIVRNQQANLVVDHDHIIHFPAFENISLPELTSFDCV
jgi:hypothetical protein